MAVLKQDKDNQKNASIKKIASFEDAITMSGYGLFNVIILISSGWGLMCVFVETMFMMFIVPASQCDLELSLSEKGLLSSICFVGVVVGCYMWGYVADTKGRRTVLIISFAGTALCTIVSSIVPWSWLFIMLKFINGFFIGGASSVVYAYCGEFHDNHHRPMAISWMSTAIALGNMFLPGLAWLILADDWTFEFLYINFRPWRLLLIAYCIPTIIAIVLFYVLPESPKFLLTQGRKDEALQILTRMYNVNNRNSKDREEYPVKEILWDDLDDGGDHLKKVGVLKSFWMQTVPLFRPEYLVKTVMVCFLQFAIFMTNSGIMMWYPEILNKMSHYISAEADEDVSLCLAVSYDEEMHANDSNVEVPLWKCKDKVKSEVFIVFLAVGMAYAIMYIFIGSVINMLGKKKLMVTITVITSIGGIAAQLVYGYTEIQILLGLFTMVGLGIAITNAIAVDVFPTHIRATALALSLTFGRIGAMTGTNVMGPLIYNSCDYLFYILAVVNLAIVIVVILIPSKRPSHQYHHHDINQSTK